MVFSFGTTPAPAANTPAPAAAPAATGGFSFGASSSSSSTPAPAATGGGFSFGAPAPATAATGGSTGGGFSFGASTPTPTTTTTAPPAPILTPQTPATATATATATVTPPANTNINTTNALIPATTATTTASSNEAIMSIPCYQEPFPNLAMHARIESILTAIHDPRIHADNNNTELTLYGQQLYHICSLSASGTESDSGDNDAFGNILSLSKTTIADIACNRKNLSAQNDNANTLLHQKLSSTFSNNADTDPAQFPRILLPHQTIPTPTPKSILSIITTMATALHIPIPSAGALYGATIIDSLGEISAGSTVGSTGSMSMSPCECTLGRGTVEYFRKRHLLPRNMGGFVRSVIENHVHDGTYIPSQSQSQSQAQNNKDVHMGNNDMNNSGSSEEGDLMEAAMDLYFAERGQVLKTLRMLIQHRLSASTAISNDGIATSNEENAHAHAHAHAHGQAQVDVSMDVNSIILRATDQLLDAGLISNLISLVKELTIHNEELSQKICNALDREEMRVRNGSDAGMLMVSATPAVPPPAPSAFGFGNSSSASTTNTTGNAFGAAAPGPASGLGSTSTASINVTDADYAMYEYTFQQRQLACQCLFYLTYHTQCTMEEATGLIDLVRDLTNGSGTGSGNDSRIQGIGTGLPLLDPIRDVPDPYTVSWNQSSNSRDSGSSKSSSLKNMMQMQSINMNMSMTPQQMKLEKKHDEWKKELIASLWSVRGLMRATVTTSHPDFSGQQLYHAMTLKSSTSSGGGCGGYGGNDHDHAEVVVVGGGKPQLMQSVTILILATLCALDGNNVLMDRTLHGPNAMGSGNALVSSIMGNDDTNSSPGNINDPSQSVKPIIDRLDPTSDGFLRWKRQDIAGLLSAAFALLLRRPVANVLASPVIGGGRGSSALKAIFRSCLEAPTTEKSLTFARVSLIPCLGTASMKSSSATLDNDFAFFMSVMSEFTAQYLDTICSFGDLPISREKWMDVEEQDLQLRRVQEEQRRQLGEWSGKRHDEAKLPTEVDIKTRPDCLDDIIALAISICSSCPDCSFRFWSTVTSEDGENGVPIHVLKPSKIVKKLEKLQARDQSLLPVYVSFLSALSLTDNPNESLAGGNGADAIFKWLEQNNRMTSSPTNYDTSKQVNWMYILFAIQWYADALNPPVAEKGWGNQQSSSQYEEDTSYYYDGDDSSPLQSTSKKTDSSGSGRTQKKELDETTSMILAAYLSLLSHVALKSDDSRKGILDIKLPPAGNPRSLTRENDAISILFALLVTSVSPYIRGLAFSAIANLVRQKNDMTLSEQEKEKSDDTVLRCWELLESCQIIPIAKLGQYSPFQNQNVPSYSNRTKKEASNWFPPNEQYGVIYEMEYVEAKDGTYPSTEGLLKLLTALFSSEVQPTNLGASWRPQTGCNPYIEYVTDFVLPRAIGSKSRDSGIYFATLADRSRLITRGLEVIDAVLTRYVPTASPLPRQQSEPSLVAENPLMVRGTSTGVIENTSIQREMVEGKLIEDEYKRVSKGPLSLVSSSIHPTRVNSEQIQYATRDFTDETVRVPAQADDLNSQAPSQIIPRPKSPGFVVLADILSANGSIFDVITKLLMDESDTEAASFQSNNLALSLFGEFVPAFNTAKVGRDFILDEHKKDVSELSVSPLSSAIVKLFMRDLLSESAEVIDENPMSRSMRTTVTKDDTKLWKEHCILLSLRILCSAAARNETFFKLCNSSQGNIRIVPVMRFQSREFGLNNPLVIKNVQVTKLSKRLLERSFDPGMKPRGELFLTVLSQYVGHQSPSLHCGNAIALEAMSLMRYIFDSSSSQDFVRSMSGLNSGGLAKTAAAISTRMSIVPLLKDNANECVLCDEILRLVLRNLEVSTTGNKNLAHIILGLGDLSLDDQRRYLFDSVKGEDTNLCQYMNALDAIIELLSDVDFILDTKTSSLASKCFEILYRLCDWHANGPADSTWFITKLCVMNKLRKANFWQIQLVRFLGSTTASNSILRNVLSQSPINGHLFSGEDDLFIVERDSNILHCVSWLLKGVSLELHSLTGCLDGFNGTNLIGKFPTSSPQPRQCRQLLKLLLSDDTMVLLQTLQDLPLSKPARLTEELLVHKPNGDAIASATCKLDGPADISGGFTAVDPEKLCESLLVDRSGQSTEPASLRDFAKKWARAWNSYVEFACGSSHISKSWSLLTSTIFSSCRQMLLANYSYNDPPVYDSSSAMALLKIILSRLCGYNGKRKSDLVTDSLNISSLLTLSTATIPLVETILELHHESNDHSVVNVSEQDILDVISLLVEAIVSCGVEGRISDGHQEESAAIIAAILSSFLESDLMQMNTRIQSLSAEVQFRNNALKAANLLILLSTAQRADEESLSLADAARSGLSSILKWFSEVEAPTKTEIRQSFLFELFSNGTLRSSKLAHVFHGVNARDSDIANLLETIACCHGGTELLVQAGLTEELISASSAYIRETDGGPRNTYGSNKSQFPRYLYGHVSLFNTMLTSEVSNDTHHRLLFDAAKFIKIHQGTVESLFDQFPENEELLIDFVTILALVSSATADAKDNINGRVHINELFGGAVLSTLDSRIEEFAFHISQFPFPTKYLPALPSQLRDALRRQTNDKDHQSNNCWWDRVDKNQPLNEDMDFVFQDPPAGTKESFYSNERRGGESWTLRMHNHASTAFRCLDVCLMYLTKRKNTCHESIQTNQISLATSLCRLLETANAIEERIKTLVDQKEGSVLHLTSLKSINNRTDDIHVVNRIESAALEELGSTVALCVGKLLILSKSCIDDNMGAMRKGGSLKSAQTYSMLQLSSRCFLDVLTYARIDEKGIGCMQRLKDAESLLSISQTLATKMKVLLIGICR